jgi:hypothetical protein
MNPLAGEPTHLFDAIVQFTVEVEYGFSLAQSAAGEKIPENGARFDVYFEGEIRGERIRGTVTGVDYVTLRPDGVSLMHVHAHITTDDGCHIAVHSEGTARRRPNTAIADLQEVMSFATSADQYKWLNGLRGAGTGISNTANGTLNLKVVRVA